VSVPVCVPVCVSTFLNCNLVVKSEEKRKQSLPQISILIKKKIQKSKKTDRQQVCILIAKGFQKGQLVQLTIQP
jgi:hypothetical protein